MVQALLLFCASVADTEEFHSHAPSRGHEERGAGMIISSIWLPQLLNSSHILIAAQQVTEQSGATRCYRGLALDSLCSGHPHWAAWAFIRSVFCVCVMVESSPLPNPISSFPLSSGVISNKPFAVLTHPGICFLQRPVRRLCHTVFAPHTSARWYSVQKNSLLPQDFHSFLFLGNTVKSKLLKETWFWIQTWISIATLLCV